MSQRPILFNCMNYARKAAQVSSWLGAWGRANRQWMTTGNGSMNNSSLALNVECKMQTRQSVDRSMFVVSPFLNEFQLLALNYSSRNACCRKFLLQTFAAVSVSRGRNPSCSQCIFFLNLAWFKLRPMHPFEIETPGTSRRTLHGAIARSLNIFWLSTQRQKRSCDRRRIRT